VFDTFLAGTTRFDKAEDKTLTATLEIYIGPFGRVKHRQRASHAPA
jgi:hypothetical protein